MRRPPLRIFDAAGSPTEIGAAHGRAWADEIRAYAAERVALAASGTWAGGPVRPSRVLEVAESMVDAHAAFDADLHAEMTAMATAAGISMAEAIVVGGFTDFVDTLRATAGEPNGQGPGAASAPESAGSGAGQRGGSGPELAAGRGNDSGSRPGSVSGSDRTGLRPESTVGLSEDDCTAMIVPDHRAGGAGFVAQTWDMHTSATDYVVLLRLRPDDAPAARVFTTAGCLGQIGMNSEGLAVGVTNLTGGDGRRGVTWPSVVRAMLRCTTTAEALDVLLGADLAGAHNFLILDRHGSGCNIEAMPSVRPISPLGHEPLVRTNHTLAPAATAVQARRDPYLQERSQARRAMAAEMLADGSTPVDAERLFALTREPSTICVTPRAPYHLESCGAVVMRPRTGDFWACWGRPTENDYQEVPAWSDSARTISAPARPAGNDQRAVEPVEPVEAGKAVEAGEVVGAPGA